MRPRGTGTRRSRPAPSTRSPARIPDSKVGQLLGLLERSGVTGLLEDAIGRRAGPQGMPPRTVLMGLLLAAYYRGRANVGDAWELLHFCLKPTTRQRLDTRWPAGTPGNMPRPWPACRPASPTCLPTKQHADVRGTIRIIRIQCPAAGTSPKTDCPEPPARRPPHAHPCRPGPEPPRPAPHPPRGPARHHPPDPDLPPDRRPVVCRQASFSVPQEMLAKHRQDLPTSSPTGGEQGAAPTPKASTGDSRAPTLSCAKNLAGFRALETWELLILLGSGGRRRVVGACPGPGGGGSG